jgi:hypothetical protein
MTGEEMRKISEAKQAWKRLSKKAKKGVEAIQSMITEDLDAFFNRKTTAAVGKPMQGLSNLRPSKDPERVNSRLLPVPISLADGHYPGPSDASENGCVYGGATLHRDPFRWHWHFTHYALLESSGFTHWLPPDVEFLPARVEL